MTTPPIRCERVIDGDARSVVLHIDPASVMVALTATDLTVTLSPVEARALSYALIVALIVAVDEPDRQFDDHDADWHEGLS